MRRLTYVDLCAGIGGMRAGLDAAGWSCRFAVDNNSDAVEVHRRAFGECEFGDVLRIEPRDLPRHDVLVSGFPCQPFSTSNYKRELHHSSGNVFEGVMRVVTHHMPSLVLLENVEGLLQNRFGHSMATILQRLTSVGYVAEWLTTNTAWLGIPQTRPRVLLVARRQSEIPGRPSGQQRKYSFAEDSVFAPFLRECGVAVSHILEGTLQDVIESRTPRIGMPKPAPSPI